MGNTESNVTSGVKKQAGTSEQPLYKLVDLKGGGLLVDMMKRATQTKQYAELDHAIKTKIEPFLYNKGKGRLIPISQLVLLRNCERSRTKLLPPLKNMEDPESEFDMDKDGNPGDFHPAPDGVTEDFHDLNKKFRDVCWDLKKRGAVGETCLHLCMLNATSLHADLAKRLLRFYPKLINDIYMSDEYYGENVLHVAIVNEDPAMVKFLLDSGANFHERCFGNFMCPEDQKATRCDSLDHEYVNVSPETNYQGYVYWGEYPLSFAACLGQEECFRLMLARGANPDNQDTNGNTALHMLVIHNKLAMFDVAYEVGANLSLKNMKCLTPLTLAAELARVELFFHIMNIEREIYWQIGSITCAAYPLSQIDTIDNETGNISKNSALNLVVFGDRDEHLELMDGALVDLLVAKWNTYVKFRFYRQFISFMLYFVLSLISFTLRPGPLSPGNDVYNATKTRNSSLENVNVTSPPGINPINPYSSSLRLPTLTDEHWAKATEKDKFADLMDVAEASEGKSKAAEDMNVKNQLLWCLALAKYQSLFLVWDFQTEDATSSEGERAYDQCVLPTMTRMRDWTVRKDIDMELRKLHPEDKLGKGSNGGNDSKNDSDSDISERKGWRQRKVQFVELSAGKEANVSVKKRGIESTVEATSVSNGFIIESSSDKNKLNESVPGEEAGEKDCRLLSFETPQDKIRGVTEFAMEVGSVLYIIAALREARFLGINMFIENLMTAPSRVMFLGSCCIMQIVPWLRFTCNAETEDIVAVIIMLTTAPYFLFFCRGFKTVGPFVVMIYRMIMGDLLRFVCIYTVFVMGFSQAYYIIFLSFDNPKTPDGVDDSGTNPMQSPVESIMAMFLMSLTNFGEYYGAFEKTEHEFVAKLMFVIYMGIVAILLVNMLIAMMGNTYQKIAETRNEWQRQWARIVLVVERGVSPRERLRKLMLYSQPMSDGRRALVLRLHQTPEDKEEMKDILDMKRVHNRMVQRRKAKGKRNLSFTGSPKLGTKNHLLGPVPPLKSIPPKPKS